MKAVASIFNEMLMLRHLDTSSAMPSHCLPGGSLLEPFAKGTGPFSGCNDASLQESVTNQQGGKGVGLGVGVLVLEPIFGEDGAEGEKQVSKKERERKRERERNTVVRANIFPRRQESVTARSHSCRIREMQ